MHIEMPNSRGQTNRQPPTPRPAVSVAANSKQSTNKQPATSPSAVSVATTTSPNKTTNADNVAMAASLEKTSISSADNEELAVLVKQAVAEAIKEAIPTLVEDVVSQLTNKTQALVDAQVAVFRGEMVAMQAEISKCVDYMEKDENRVAEVDSRLSSSVSKLAEKHAQLEDKIADMEDRSRRDNVRVQGVPENAETLNVLAFLTDAIPRWFPNLGSVEIMRAHRLGAPKEDANGRPVSRTIIFKLLHFTDRDKILKAARDAAVEMEGRTIRFTPDYSPHTFRRRLAFSEAMDALQKLNFRTFLLYPAKLKVMRGGVSHFFNTPREVKGFINSLGE